MALLAWLFIKHLFAPMLPAAQLDSYVAGLILLAAAPCTAMVFVWSRLTGGDPLFTLSQVALNDSIMIIAFAPLVGMLLGISAITVPWSTLLTSVVLHIVIPVILAQVLRRILLARGQEAFDAAMAKIGPWSITALLVTLVLLFAFQGEAILEQPLVIALLAVPILIQVFFNSALAYWLNRLVGEKHNIACPSALIGASNFFELAVATAIGLFGFDSGAALATVVGVLIEVPVMLLVVRIVNRSKHWYPNRFRAKITLVTLVGGFASTVFIPLTQEPVDTLGWLHALLALAEIHACVCLPIHWRALGGGADMRDSSIRKAKVRTENDASVQRALKTPVFWALAACFTAYYATFAALTFHLVPLMTERHVSQAVILATMAAIGPAQVLARVLWFTLGHNVSPKIVGLVITTAFPVSVVILIMARTSSVALILFAVIYGGANGMMTILRGTIVKDVIWTEGYGAISGLLSAPSNVAKGVAPITAALIWSASQSYTYVEWAVLLVSLIATVAFGTAVFATRSRNAVTVAASD